MKVSGVIDSIVSKTVGNGGTVYTAVIDGTEVDLGFKCNHSEGEYVDLDVESTKWGLKIAQPGSKGPARPAAKPQSASVAPRQAAAKKQFPVDPDSKDHIIIRQNALTNANAAVATAVNAGITFESAEEVYNEVIKVAYNLTGFAMGTLDQALVEQAKAQQTEQNAKLAAVADEGA
jgi:hypothetical protein